MSKTIVLQSHRQPLPYSWVQTCIDSVKAWADQNGFTYKFIGDELFDFVPAPLLEKTRSQLTVATDLARLKALQKLLRQDFQTVIWCDADFLIFNPKNFVLPSDSFSVGREVWIQSNEQPKLNAHIKVHNAFLMFRQGNSFLDFYTDTAERLLSLNEGSIPPQFIGPKLLTAIHNVVQCPVMETAGMLSPIVVKDIANGGGTAVDLFKQKSLRPIAAANICASLIDKNELNKIYAEKCIDLLIKAQKI